MDTNKQTTTNKPDYSAQYKHPNWQKLRLKVLDRDNYTCRICGDTESTLHVHHSFYIKGADVWDYYHMDLLTLCDSCHKETHDKMDLIQWSIGVLFTEEPNSLEMLKELTRLMHSQGPEGDVYILVKHLVNHSLRYEEAIRVMEDMES